MSQRVRIGVTMPQFTARAADLRDGIARAEDSGFDSLWAFDHLWPLGGDKERPFVECWTTLAWAAAATSSIDLGTLVTRSTLRTPAVLAKMTATVATIAPGRVTIAIGSGDVHSRAENEAFGFPYLAGANRIEQLSDVVDAILLSLGSDAPLDLKRRYVELRGFPLSPSPPRRPKVWVGGRSDDALAIAARADGWNGWGGDPAAFARDGGTVVELARGRAIDLSWGGNVVIGSDDDEARARAGTRDPARYLVGGPDRVCRRLEEFVAAGATEIIVALPDAGRPGAYELLADTLRSAGLLA